MRNRPGSLTYLYRVFKRMSGTPKMDKARTITADYIRMMTGRMLPLLSLLFVTVLYAHRLSQAAYGTYQSVWMYANLVSVLMGFGITTIIFSTNTDVLVSVFRSNKKSILYFYSAVWIVSLALFLTLTSFSPLLKTLVVFFIIFQNINSITETWLLKQQGELKYFRINLLYSILFFGWHYYILTDGYSLTKLIAGTILISFVKFVLLRSSVGLPRMAAGKIDERKFFAHWAYLGTNDIINIFSKWIDKLILVYLLTPAEFAVFFNGSIEIPLFAIFISITGAYAMIQLSKNATDNNLIQNVFSENFKLISSLAFPLFFFLLFFREEVFILFFSDKYLASVPIFAITILILPIKVNEYSLILKVRGRGNLVTRGSVMELILATLLIFILYPLYGMRGAAAALVLSTIFQVGFYLYHTRRITGISLAKLIPFQPLVARFIICGVSFFVLKTLVNKVGPMISIASGLTLLGAMVLIWARPYLSLMWKKD